MSQTKFDKLKETLRELIEQDLEEASVTGALDGGEGPPKTPFAFSGKRKKDKKKRKSIASQSGYSMTEAKFAVKVNVGTKGESATIIIDAGSKAAAEMMVVKNLKKGRKAIISVKRVEAGKAKQVDKKLENVTEGRKSKNQRHWKLVNVIHENISAIVNLVQKDKRDPKEVIDTMGPVLQRAVKETLKQKFKPNAKPAFTTKKDIRIYGDTTNQEKINIFITELKKFAKLLDIVVKKPTKVSVKRLQEAWTTIWNSKFGANIALNGQFANTIIESISITEGKYHDYRNDESLTAKQKIGRSMMEVRDTLKTLEGIVGMNIRLKTEIGVDSTSYWKRTHGAMKKISERLVKLANKVGQLH